MASFNTTILTRLATLIGAAFLMSLFIASTSSQMGPQGPAVSAYAYAYASAPTPVKPLLRPQKWMSSAAPTVADPASFASYERTIQSLAARHRVPERDRVRPLADPTALARVSMARRLIASSGALIGAWAWDDVRDVVAQFGNGVVLADGNLMMPNDDTALAMFDDGQNALILWPTTMRKVSDEELAAGLIHEATHAVADRRSRELSGLTTNEITALAMLCADFRLLYDFSSEALAFKNQGRWFADRGETSLVHEERYDGMVILTSIRTDAGEQLGYDAYGREIRQYVENEYIADHGGVMPKMVVNCGVPRVMRGPRKGELFFPSDVAPDILVPLIDAVY